MSDASKQPSDAETSPAPDMRLAAQNLVDKLDEIGRHPSFQGIWGYLHVHGYKYDGPNYKTELDVLRFALNPNTRPPDWLDNLTDVDAALKRSGLSGNAPEGHLNIPSKDEIRGEGERK